MWGVYSELRRFTLLVWWYLMRQLWRAPSQLFGSFAPNRAMSNTSSIF